jgi:hypothetical protein
VSKTDFDFLVGTWSVQHRRLTDPLDPDCETWIDFTTVADAHHILGGLGNADQTSGTLPDGTTFHGYSLRLFTPETDEWSIWWASAGRPGVLDDPVRGSFENGIGTFVGPAQHGDRPVSRAIPVARHGHGAAALGARLLVRQRRNLGTNQLADDPYPPLTRGPIHPSADRSFYAPGSAAAGFDQSGRDLSDRAVTSLTSICARASAISAAGHRTISSSTFAAGMRHNQRPGLDAIDDGPPPPPGRVDMTDNPSGVSPGAWRGRKRELASISWPPSSTTP